MSDPAIIATLFPCDTRALALDAFRHDYNSDRYLPGSIRNLSTQSSRETTPSESEWDNDSAPRIVLRFDKRPKDPSKGFAFGSNRRLCDVFLGNHHPSGMSGVHFYLTFGIAADKKHHLMVRDVSRNGMSVSYDDQGGDEKRCQYTWFLDLVDEGEQKMIVKVHLVGLSFEIHLPDHHECREQYDASVEEFVQNTETSDLPVDLLGIHSDASTAMVSQPSSPRQRPFFVTRLELGSGAFGSVDKVVDERTRATYARKTFKKRRGEGIDWLRRYRKEFDIMDNNPHANIVRVIEFREGAEPFLIMEYLPMGNVMQINQQSPLSQGECRQILLQTLQALEYLHSRKVTHRDIKSENILVASRYPLHIKLGDFGLAKDQEEMKTQCGTRGYWAPEVMSERNYTPAVDIWSLGVIILTYTYPISLPKQRPSDLEVCCILSDTAARHHQAGRGPMAELLAIGMLVLAPNDRYTATRCLQEGQRLGLFENETDSDSGSGATTPRAQNTTSRDDSGSVVRGAIQDLEQLDTGAFDAGKSTRLKGEAQKSSDQDAIGSTCSDDASGEPYSGRRSTAKRQRSLASDSAITSSKEHPSKRRPSEVTTRPDNRRNDASGGSANAPASHDQSVSQPQGDSIAARQSQRRTTGSGNGGNSSEEAQRLGLTYPKGLQDITDNSSFSIP
ncbi:uncharacterized protein KY384_005651 [Bacidia gigantensis]|uniref:uncharacterized protein n=1 Tax=Bacidia gigantensis TaxID=2732470 RepID=UPI001D040A87|nr:uncharacterized protein KY384_005651 [Bacidia gigantensis]KAG8530168.1 hypothetical protein KY384_005651 [Bacidia gigantensis]